MGDQPSAERLLQAMAATLTDQVVPATSGGAAHAGRVVANLCRILSREVVDAGGDEDEADLLALLASDQPPDAGMDDLMRALDDRLREGDTDFARAALPIVRQDVERRLAIAKPSYLQDRA